MKKLTRIQRLILKDLFKANGKIDSFTLFRRYYITPPQLASSVFKFIKNGYIKNSDGMLILTSKGKKWLKETKFLVGRDGDCPWKEVPDDFRQAQLPLWTPYVPEIELLDKAFKIE